MRQERWRKMYYPYVQEINRQERRVMTVTGVGKLSVEPNIVRIQLEVITENNELRQAQQENSNIMNRVIGSLLELGIERENIKTTSYNIFPQYDYVEGKQLFRGYKVTNAITITTTNIDQAGSIIDVAVQNGVNSVSNIKFDVENEQLEYRKALSLALRDALAKAQSMAKTMQLQLDPHPIKISEVANEQPVAYPIFSTMERGASTPIEQGQITIKAVVNVQFQY